MAYMGKLTISFEHRHKWRPNEHNTQTFIRHRIECGLYMNVSMNMDNLEHVYAYISMSLNTHTTQAHGSRWFSFLLEICHKISPHFFNYISDGMAIPEGILLPGREYIHRISLRTVVFKLSCCLHSLFDFHLQVLTIGAHDAYLGL